jgi:hypothetical protein
VTNTGARCDGQIEISIRPEWGSRQVGGSEFFWTNFESGWSSLGPDTAKVTDTALKTNEKRFEGRGYVMSTQKAKYLPEQFQ